jgi:anti-sigma regulatory factor (Ser/Thr protein kinase)
MEPIENNSSKIFLGKYTLPINKLFISSAVKHAEQIALLLNMNENQSVQLQMAIEEAVGNAIQHYAAQSSPDEFIDLV